jgi:hypothetical protein
MKCFLLIVVCGLFCMSCVNDAMVASANVSKDADNFKIYRRVVFYNGITDEYILQIEGFCSIESTDRKLVVMVKTDSGEYLKHFLGLSDNVTYFAEQIQPAKVSDKKYKVIFKPSAIIPNVEMR